MLTHNGDFLDIFLLLIKKKNQGFALILSELHGNIDVHQANTLSGSGTFTHA